MRIDRVLFSYDITACINNLYRTENRIIVGSILCVSSACGGVGINNNLMAFLETGDGVFSTCGRCILQLIRIARRNGITGLGGSIIGDRPIVDRDGERDLLGILGRVGDVFRYGNCNCFIPAREVVVIIGRDQRGFGGGGAMGQVRMDNLTICILTRQRAMLAIIVGHRIGVALPDGVKVVCADIVQAHHVAGGEGRSGAVRRRVPANERVAGILAGEAEIVISRDLNFVIVRLRSRELGNIPSVIAMICDYNRVFFRRIVRRQHDVGRSNRDFLAGIIAIARRIRPVGEDHVLGRSKAALRRLGFGIHAIAVRVNDILARARAGSVGNGVDVALKYRTDGYVAKEGSVDVYNLAFSIHPAQKLLAALLNEVERIFILVAARNGAALGHFRLERLLIRVHGYRYRDVNRHFFPISVEHQVLRRHGLAREVIWLRIVRNVLWRHEIPALEHRILISGRMSRFATLVCNRGLVANLLARLNAVVVLCQGVGYTVIIEVGFPIIKRRYLIIPLCEARDGEIVLIISQTQTVCVYR